MLRCSESILCLFLFVCNGACQDGFEVKLSSHFAFDGSPTIPYFDEGQTGVFDYRWLAPAFSFKNGNKKYDEIELTNLVFQRFPSETVDNKFSMGIRYEHGYYLTKYTEAKAKLCLGFSFRGYGATEQINNLNVRGIEIENRIYGLAISLAPKFHYRLAKPVAIELGPYLDLVNVVTRIEYVYDPFLPEEERRSQDFRAVGMKLFAKIALCWVL